MAIRCKPLPATVGHAHAGARERDRANQKHPYDSRAAQAALEEAGFVRGGDGFYANRNGDPLRVEVATDGGAGFERDNTQSSAACSARPRTARHRRSGSAREEPAPLSTTAWGDSKATPPHPNPLPQWGRGGTNPIP